MKRTISTGFKVWVITFVETSEVEIFSSAEAAYEVAKSRVEEELPEYVDTDLKFLEESYHENKNHFYVEDLLWVDVQDVDTVIDTDNPYKF